MGRAVLVLNCDRNRQQAMRWVEKAPPDTRVEFKAPRRSLPQNDRLWAMLSDIAEQKEHCGRKYTTDQWKVLMMHACGREVKFLPALDKQTFVPYGQSSRDMTKDEMSELLAFVEAWGAENGVVFHDDLS